MTTSQNRSAYSRRRLPLVLLVSVCLIASSGCFFGERYEPPGEMQGYPIFDDYLAEVLMYNEDVRSFDHTWNHEYYYIDVTIMLDSTKKQPEERDTTKTIKIENFCINADCLDYVYCPPLAQDTAFILCTRFKNEENCTYFRWLRFGALDLQDSCRAVEVSLAAVLVDVATDSVLAVDSLRMSMDVKQGAIPAFLSNRD